MTATRVVSIAEHGGPEVLRLEQVHVGEPGPGEARVRNAAIGLNFIDVYHRSGLYPVPNLPTGLGYEGAGVVEAVGPDVSELAPGDRVVYATGPLGAYADIRLMPADRLVRLPEDIATDQAAAMMLKGMTVEYLIRRTYPVRRGETVIFHAAAGGVGLIAVQWLKHLGATVIGTVGSPAKAELARAHGCDHVINYATEDISARVREITGGAGVPVVYDSVGAATFIASLDSLAPRGMLVSFGNASGPVPPFELGMLAQRGSLYVTRPSLFTYVATREELLEAAAALFAVVRSGAVRIEINQRYSLSDVAHAHRDLEARSTTGCCLLMPAAD